MQKDCSLLLANLKRLCVCVVVAVAAENDPCAVALSRLDLGNGSGGGHNYGCGDAKLCGGAGDALSVVPCGGGDDAGDLTLCGKHGYLVGSAPDLEGTCFLTIFAL